MSYRCQNILLVSYIISMFINIIKNKERGSNLDGNQNLLFHFYLDQNDDGILVQSN